MVRREKAFHILATPDPFCCNYYVNTANKIPLKQPIWCGWWAVARWPMEMWNNY
jgi:hypothetical protein